MSDLPKNKDAVIKECLNCEMEFEEVKKIGEWIKCDEESGGCGFNFMLRVKAGKLEKSADE